MPLFVMKNNKTIFSILLLPTLLTGCWSITFKSDTPTEYIERKNTIESFYGSTQEDIIRELGEPEQIEKIGGSTYFIYQWKRSDKNILFIILPIPIAGGRFNANLYCLFLGFDEDNHLIKRRSGKYLNSDVHPWAEQEWESDCIDYFYPLRLLSPEEIQKQSEERLSEANKWKLKKEIETYCPSADQDLTDAQTYIGDLHYLGAYGIEKNLIQAYVWYNLAANNGNSYASEQLYNLMNELSPQQLSKAQAHLEEWEPGQCERDLMKAIPEENG